MVRVSLKTILPYLLLSVIVIGIAVPHLRAEQRPGLAPGETVSSSLLTEDAKIWLETNPDILLGYPEGFDPGLMRNDDGELYGVIQEYWDLMNERLGTDIKLVMAPWSEIFEMVRKKEIAGLAASSERVRKEHNLVKTEPDLYSYVGVFGKSSEARLSYPEDLYGKKVGVPRGIRTTAPFIKPFESKMELVEFDVPMEALKSLQMGRIDYLVHNISRAYQIAKYQMYDITPRHVFWDRPYILSAGIREDLPQLASILNRVKDLVSDEEYEALVSKWMHVKRAENTVTLTPEERLWLEENHTIRIRMSEQAPYLFSKAGVPVGIIVDLLDVINRETGIRFDFVIPSPPFSEDLKGIIQHTGPDVLGSLTPTTERKKKILFTEPYVSAPKFIFTRDDADFIASMENLAGKNVATIKGYLVHKEITELYPDIKLEFYKNNKEALRAVSTGKAFAFIGSILSTPFMINQYGLKNLKAAAPSGLQDATVSMAVRNDWPELRDIINRVLVNMPVHEKAAIINKWSSVRIEYGIRHGDVLKWAAILAGIGVGLAFFFIYWNRSLAGKVKERTIELEDSNQLLSNEISVRKEAELALRESRDYLESLTDSLADAVYSVNLPDRTIAWAKDTFGVLGYEPTECIGKSTEFLYPSRDDYLGFGEALNSAIVERKDVLHMEQDLRKKNGEIIPVDLTISVFRTDGKETSVTSIARDMTELKKREEQLQAYQERLKSLASQLTISEEKERRAIAADLHDNVGHSLALARMQMEGIEKCESELERRALVKDISNIILHALKDTRSLISDLSSPSMNEIGLGAAISEWIEEHIVRRYGLEFAFVDDIDTRRKKSMDENIRALLFRNVRELLINVVKHARANKVSVHLMDDGSNVNIIVQDDGIGFDPENLETKNGQQGGFGLFSIQERMADMGGTLDIQSSPSQGSRMVLVVPVEMQG